MRPGPLGGLVRQAAVLPVLVGVAAGLVVVSTGHWRIGSGVVGLSMVLAAALRVALAPRHAGWLVVRSRAFDAALLLALGVGTVVLAASVPKG